MTSKIPSSSLDKPKKFWLLGDTITFKATSKETGGQYSLWEIKAVFQNGPPPHYHTNMEEGVYVLDGEFSFWYKDKSINADAGSFISVQREIVHTYKNIGKNIGRLLVIGIPSGFESFVGDRHTYNC